MIGVPLNRRPLTLGEVDILRMVQEGFGLQNTEEEVFFTDAGEAAIFVKARDGIIPVCVALTNLAAWRADGTISSDAELKRDWLRVGRT